MLFTSNFWAACAHTSHLCESEVIISPTHKPNAGGWRDSVYTPSAAPPYACHFTFITDFQFRKSARRTCLPADLQAPFTYVCIELAASLVRRLHVFGVYYCTMRNL
ncbi:hypothetical protein EVAR_94445_1 [Eumeta japonica]|uniref:Uncharacterized protein n=1 Tax=Eumeta variegata TaxID=151549 RepID=A0A4C1TQ68_EUMVA|nr:hypothetical protein EVAR_94445_1 [Eumeta japonica]